MAGGGPGLATEREVIPVMGPSPSQLAMVPGSLCLVMSTPAAEMAKEGVQATR
jgi:hypothetical protein